MFRYPVLFGAFLLLTNGCVQPPGAAPGAAQNKGILRLDSAQLVTDLRVLAADSMEGRRTGTPGSERARRYLTAAFQQAGLKPFGSDFEHPFEMPASGGSPARGVNLVGFIPGTARPDRFIVVTAHYDHVGVRQGQIYNGADDNASGVAALLALARHFTANPPENSIIFAALDAEEMGLRGARAFVQNPPVDRGAMVLNVNFDMVGRNQRGEMYAAGAFHYPFLRPVLERIAASAPVTLKLGHDSPDLGAGDWTQQSDHGAFHAAGIPFVYFGVEDHPDYHQPTDDAERIEPGFFLRSVRTLGIALEELDNNLEEIARSGRGD